MDSRTKEFFGISFGNIIEWYDFGLSIYFVIFISKAFFPNFSHFYSLLLSFATFFIGFLARPIGGLIFGWLGDQYSIKKIMNICIVMMAVSTFAIACLPSYNSIGVWAPCLLLICRLLQGLSAGGQFPGLITHSVRHNMDQKAYYCSLAYVISTLGFLLASCLGYILTHFFKDQLSHNLWRVPYAFSLVLFIIYYFINKKTNLDINIKFDKKTNMLSGMFKQYKNFIAILLVMMMSCALYYLFFTYLVNYFILHVHLSDSLAYLLNTLLLVVVCIFYPITGKLADRVSNKALFYGSWLVIAALTWPMLNELQANNIFFSLIMLLIITIASTSLQAVITPMYTLVFDKKWEASCCATAVGIATGIAGGSPMYAHILVNWSQQYGLALLIFFSLIIGLIGYVWSNKIIEAQLESN